MNAALEALACEVERAGALLDTLKPDDWSQPTRCPPMTVFELAAHAWRGGIRINEMLEAGPVESEPEKDGATYFRYDPAAIAAGVVERAQAVARGLDPATFARDWRTGWDAALGRARATLESDDPVVTGVFGLIRLSEYLRTRIVEVTVHHLDLRDALGLEPDPDPGALEATGDVLRDLLGTDLRSRVDDLRFVLTGTGRAPLDDAERSILGPLADRFPLLA
jgi:uncharacterized protein (TIGR03083 family)